MAPGDKDTNPIVNKLIDAGVGMIDQTESLNAAFVGTRLRIIEMNEAIADGASKIIFLGGSLSDVSKTIIGIAEGARRNIITNEEQLSKIYATSKIVGKDASYLVEEFGKIGTGISQIGPQMEESIKYVQSIGLNAKTITGLVLENMEQLNRFQFEGGVQGLTKMAAQASMLRFNMYETVQFADKVLDPEGAINVAAAFQRLGVSVGNLADPFQLMNLSINDPSGLQDSLINMSKEFTYFDEKTKGFKINPQGVLTLREIAKETGLSFENLSKSALAAADFDVRLSKISMSMPEEDKMLLANMATMGEGGKYEVTMVDEKGKTTTKNLEDILPEEFDKLKEQQKNAPKTVEDIQRSQLTTQQSILSAFDSFVAKGTYGAVSTSFVTSNLEGFRQVTENLAKSIDDNTPDAPGIRKGLDGVINDIRNLMEKQSKGGVTDADYKNEMVNFEKTLTEKISGLADKTKEGLLNGFNEFKGRNTGGSDIQSMIREITGGATDMGKRSVHGIMSGSNIDKSGSEKIQTQSNMVNQAKMDVGGTITIKVDAPPGISQKLFDTYFDTPAFKQKIYAHYNSVLIEKGVKSK